MVIAGKIKRWYAGLSEGLQKIISNTGWLFMDHILRMGVGLFVGVWVARYLGPERFGILSYAIAFVSLFSVLSTLGLDSIVVRDLVRFPERQNLILGSVFYLKLAGGCTGFLTVILLHYFLKPGEPLTRLIIGLCGFGLVIQSTNTIDLWFKSKLYSKYTVLSQNISFLITSALKVVLILSGAALVGFAAANLAQTALAAVGLFYCFRRKRQNPKEWRPNFSVAVDFLRQSWPLIFSGIFVSIYVGIDQIMLGEMIDDKAVGTYAAAVRISEIWYFVPVAIATSVFPSIVKSRRLSEYAYHDRIQKYLDLNVLLAIGLSVPATIFSPWIVRTLYGNAYAGAEKIFSIHIWACLFVFLGIARGQYLINEGLIKFSFLSSAAGALVNIGLNVILIPRYQGVGAAVATVVSYGVSGYFSSFCYSKTMRMGLMETKAIAAPLRLLRVLRKKA